MAAGRVVTARVEAAVAVAAAAAAVAANLRALQQRAPWQRAPVPVAVARARCRRRPERLAAVRCRQSGGLVRRMTSSAYRRIHQRRCLARKSRRKPNRRIKFSLRLRSLIFHACQSVSQLLHGPAPRLPRHFQNTCTFGLQPYYNQATVNSQREGRAFRSHPEPKRERKHMKSNHRASRLRKGHPGC